MEYLSILNAAKLEPMRETSWTDEVPASLKRRDPRIWQMAYVATHRAITASPLMPRSIVVATALGALDETTKFLDGVFSDGLGSPRNFIASVHNGVAGKIAQEFKISGPNLTLCDGHNSFASTVGACSLLLDKDFPALVVAIDENIELLDLLIPHLSPDCRRALDNNEEEGAIAFLLSNKAGGHGPRLRSKGPLFIGDRNADEACETLAASQKTELSPIVSLPSKTTGSFLSVPFGVFELFRNGSAGHYSLGSFSPSSKSMALVELWQ
jgi:hypothetical protein